MSSYTNSEYNDTMNAQELRHIVASNIKKYRKLNNLTQMALAEMADISVGYLCDLESGRKWGTPETIAKLVDSLQIDPYQLFLAETTPDVQPLAPVLILLKEKLKSDIDLSFQEILIECKG